MAPLGKADSRLLADWRALAEHLDANASLHPLWLEAAAGSPNATGRHTLELRDDLGLAAVTSFTVRRARMFGVPLRIAELGGASVHYHFEILARDRSPAILDALLDALLEASRCDVVKANGVVVDSATAQALERLALRRGCEVLSYAAENSPFLEIEGEWQAFLGRRSKKFRYKLKRRAETAAALGGDIRWFCTTDLVAELLNAIFAIERRSWKHAAGKAITSSEAERRYHAGLLPVLARHGALLANVLYFDAKPVAYNLCCNWRGWVGQLKTSFDLSYAEYSPGSVVIDAAIRRAFELGTREFDFLGNADPHKLMWTDNVRLHHDYFVFDGFSGRWVGRTKRFLHATFHSEAGMASLWRKRPSGAMVSRR